MKELKVVTYAPDQTRELGKKLGSLIDGSFLITLSGDLGAGKTTFTQGLARGLEITRNVTSPTFTLMKSYKGRLPLYHIDAYRLEDIDQDLGFEEYVDGDGVCVIEWSNFIEDVLPEERLSINLTIGDDDSRMLVFSACGDKYEEVLERLCTQ